VDNGDPAPRRWKEHLPAILILGSPVAAAGMAHSVALIGLFLMPEVGLLNIAASAILAINGLLAVLGAAAGALRVGGTAPTRIAVLIASVVFAAAVYLGTIHFADDFIPGYGERYGP
jgi:hypothetical protein